MNTNIYYATTTGKDKYKIKKLDVLSCVVKSKEDITSFRKDFDMLCFKTSEINNDVTIGSLFMGLGLETGESCDVIASNSLNKLYTHIDSLLLNEYDQKIRLASQNYDQMSAQLAETKIVPMDGF
jgi:hypothetical protein